MKAITIPYWGQRPEWWNKFEETLKFPDGYWDLPSKQARIIEREQINHELMKYGGRLQPRYMTDLKSSDMLVTFRLDSNYTFFMLKFS